MNLILKTVTHSINKEIPIQGFAPWILAFQFIVARFRIDGSKQRRYFSIYEGFANHDKHDHIRMTGQEAY